MESPLFLNAVFPPVGKIEKKSFIPIRSITYKKDLSDKKDVDERKLMSTTLQKFATSPSPLVTAYQVSPTRASTNYGSKPGSSTLSPIMSCTMHKLKLGGAKESPTKPRMTLLPEVKTPKVPEPQASLLNSSCYSQTTSNNRRLKFGKDNKGSAQEDYFKLLFDENRKTFSVEECEGVDEFYTEEHIMKRIHSMGFRDSQYYSTKVQKKRMTIPDERSIREEYTFKMPAVISEMENENTLATHVLGGTQNNVNFVQSMIESANNEIGVIKEEKKELEKDIEEIKQRFEKQTDDIEVEFLKKFAKLTSMIKEDFVTAQNDNFRFTKEITIVKRDQMKLNQEIEDCIPPLENLEDVLYGQGVFNLVPNDPNLNQISTTNLRAEMQSTMRNTRFIH